MISYWRFYISILFLFPILCFGQKIYYQPPNGTEGTGGGLTQAQMDSLYWKLNGNAINALKILGTTNGQDLRIVTNNVQRVTVSGTSGFVGINTMTPQYRLDIEATADPIRLHGLQVGNLQSDKILVATPDGVARWVEPSLFGNAENLIYADNDAAAAALGVALKSDYLASDTNTLGVKAGTRVRREY
jgi:hypothetical protein